MYSVDQWPEQFRLHAIFSLKMSEKFHYLFIIDYVQDVKMHPMYPTSTWTSMFRYPNPSLLSVNMLWGQEQMSKGALGQVGGSGCGTPWSRCRGVWFLYTPKSYFLSLVGSNRLVVICTSELRGFSSVLCQGGDRIE